RRGREQRREDSQGRGLAGAIRTDEPEDAPLGDVEGQISDGGELAVALVEPLDLNAHGDPLAMRLAEPTEREPFSEEIRSRTNPVGATYWSRSGPSTAITYCPPPATEMAWVTPN